MLGETAQEKDDYNSQLKSLKAKQAIPTLYNHPQARAHTPTHAHTRTRRRTHASKQGRQRRLADAPGYA